MSFTFRKQAYTVDELHVQEAGALGAMTPTVTIAEMGAHAGGQVRLRGWVYQKRSSGKVRSARSGSSS